MRITKLTLCLTIALFFLLLQACQNKTAPITIVHNATIYTVNNNWDTAEAMAFNNDKIIELGSSENLLQKFPKAQLIDAQGKYIYPGIIDAHCHFTGYATSQDDLELYGVQSEEALVEAVKKYAQTHTNGWIVGRGWDQNQWQSKAYPTNELLNKLFPNRPIYLSRIDGHAALCNQAALQLANIDASTKFFGGTVFTNNNLATGVLLDNAATAVQNKIPIPNKQDAINYFVKAQQECFSYGLTGVVDCGVQDYIVDWVQEAQQKKLLQMRVYLMLADDSINYAKYLKQKPELGNSLQILGFKVYSDGALGSRGAYLLADYHDAPGNRGLLLKPLDSIKRIAETLINSPYQMCTHAIGDAGNKAILDIYANVLKTKNDRRWRIEHAQVVSNTDIQKFGDYSIIPSIQPTHATSDMAWAANRLGMQRVQTAYAYKALIQQNGWAPLGTDFPVEYINPFYTFYSSVFRLDAEAKMPKGWQLENAISRQDALRGITLWAAKGNFQEKSRGSLEPNKLADFIIADTDLMHANPVQCRNTKVLQTWIGGNKVWEKTIGK